VGPRPVESNAGVGDRDCAAERAPERMADRHYTRSVHYMIMIIIIVIVILCLLLFLLSAS